MSDSGMVYGTSRNSGGSGCVESVQSPLVPDVPTDKTIYHSRWRCGVDYKIEIRKIPHVDSEKFGRTFGVSVEMSVCSVSKVPSAAVSGKGYPWWFLVFSSYVQ
jgi:hypothetical protein